MRIIFLNSWFGQVEKPFFDFVKKESSGADIFCFMEFSPELFSRVSAVLTDFDGKYEVGHYLKSLDVVCGQATFVRKGNKIDEIHNIPIYELTDENVGFLLATKIDLGGKKIWVGNVHGIAYPGEKQNTPVRLKQSQTIIDFFADKKEPKIIGGDFNLDFGTKSVKMFEESGYRNLIRDFNIKNTRNRLSWEKFNNVQYFADFTFVSSEIKSKNFEVPHIEISDHLPQVLDFEV